MTVSLALGPTPVPLPTTLANVVCAPAAACDVAAGTLAGVPAARPMLELDVAPAATLAVVNCTCGTVTTVLSVDSELLPATVAPGAVVPGTVMTVETLTVVIGIPGGAAGDASVLTAAEAALYELARGVAGAGVAGTGVTPMVMVVGTAVTMPGFWAMYGAQMPARYVRAELISCVVPPWAVTHWMTLVVKLACSQ